MKETPKCAGCSYMGWPVPRRITGNNRHLGGPRSSCMCRHPEAVASFKRVGGGVDHKVTCSHCGRRRYGATYTIEKHSKSKA